MQLTSTKLECETIKYSFALNDLLPLVKVKHLESLQIFILGPEKVGIGQEPEFSRERDLDHAILSQSRFAGDRGQLRSALPTTRCWKC